MSLRGKPVDEEALVEFLHQTGIRNDLLAFVMAVFPWGQRGTPLAELRGPRAWQREDLEEMTAHVLAGGGLFRKATAAGRGIGKSAYVSWIVLWLLSTRLGSTVIVTANTEEQLKSKTFAEIGKWANLAINKHWFDVSVLSVRPAEWFGKLVREQLSIDTGYYYARGQLWSEENPDAFAGTHNPLGLAVLFDEASGIPAPIFTVTTGFFTEQGPDRYWLTYSNARRNSGGFYDAFHAPESPWRTRHLDARTVEGLDQTVFQGLIAQYGIDSDQVRVEVLGQFPKQGNRQFIGNELVHAAQAREVVEDKGAPLVMGVDIARYGDDKSVFRFRCGRDARSIAPIRYGNRDNMFIANELAKVMEKYRPDAVYIDAGSGTGVIDRVKELGFKVHEVWFGSSSTSPEWMNKRTEMWADMRDWLGGGCIDRDPLLFGDLTAPEYKAAGKAHDKTMLQSKEELKAMGYRSPDDGDALALTFAGHVSRKDTATSRQLGRVRLAKDLDWPMFT